MYGIVNPFKVYLKAELGKLKKIQNIDSLQERVSTVELLLFGIPENKDSILSVFFTQSSVDEFVDNLKPSLLEPLSKILSIKWRNNSVYRKIKRHQSWILKEIPIKLIYISYTESKVKGIFRDHSFRLTEIVEDPRLWNLPPYSTNSFKEKRIDYPICLAEKEGMNYRIFDGNHRAIRLVLDEINFIPIVFNYS